VAAARELTKLHEEWLCGTPAQVEAALKAKDKILGEFVVVVHRGNDGPDHHAQAG
jgi:16S rRNA C1402 (ribose-2'-O) methylase RsmI